jgi:hypothetical protein
VRTAVAEAISARLQPRVDEYAYHLSQVGTGSAGVRALAYLYDQINGELRDLLVHPPATQLMSAYVEREREIVPAAVPELLGDVAALPTLEACGEFRERGLGRPEAWTLVLDTPLPRALGDRQVALWRDLEARDDPFWPLPETSPGEEALLAGIRAAPHSEARPPMGHEIMLAMIREIEAANGERTGPNTVIYRLLPLNVAMSSASLLPPSLTFNLPDIQVPVEALITLRRVSSVDCSQTANQISEFRYSCAYRVSADVEGLAGARGLFASELRDIFELTGSGWRSPTIEHRLAESSVLAWGAIAEGLVSGLDAAGCVAGAFGGIVDLDCY